jgi:ubiquinone biosynthesis protein UbiJ
MAQSLALSRIRPMAVALATGLTASPGLVLAAATDPTLAAEMAALRAELSRLQARLEQLEARAAARLRTAGHDQRHGRCGPWPR